MEGPGRVTPRRLEWLVECGGCPTHPNEARGGGAILPGSKRVAEPVGDSSLGQTHRAVIQSRRAAYFDVSPLVSLEPLMFRLSFAVLALASAPLQLGAQAQARQVSAS